MEKAASIFSLFCGIAMLAVWSILLATGQVPELQTQPLETIFLLVAEFLTAISLLMGGFALISRKKWGLRMDLAALGMLLYCVIFSIGVFGQQNNLPATIFFVVITILAAIFSTYFVREAAK